MIFASSKRGRDDEMSSRIAIKFVNVFQWAESIMGCERKFRLQEISICRTSRAKKCGFHLTSIYRSHRMFKPIHPRCIYWAARVHAGIYICISPNVSSTMTLIDGCEILRAIEAESLTLAMHDKFHPSVAYALGYANTREPFEVIQTGIWYFLEGVTSGKRNKVTCDLQHACLNPHS